MEPTRTSHSTVITNDKSIFLRKSGLGSISDVVIASVHSEKTILKKLMMIKSNGLYLKVVILTKK